jgi:Butirosin biosynthesis protein H, N-terminal
MTESKHLKARIRARMARTGERYMAARRHVVGEAAVAADDHGWRLRGGVHPDSAAIAAVLDHHGAPVSEAMVLGVGGGLGAGYILWEFEAHGAGTLVLGFRNQWQYPDRWARKVLERLGVDFALHETSGAKSAAARLDASLAAGRPALVTIDRAESGYWHLPASHSGRGGYPVVVHAIEGDRVRIDDRNLAPLSVPRERLDAARARVVSLGRLRRRPPPGPIGQAAGRRAAYGLSRSRRHPPSPRR